MYLEISPRNSGKTYRLQEAVREYINSRPDRIANIVLLNEKSLDEYPEDLKTSKQVRFVSPQYKNFITPGYVNVRNFFDNFDQMDFSFKKNGSLLYSTSEDDYYTTTPARLRKMSGLYNLTQATGDNLIDLLLKNNRMYVSYVTRLAPDWICAQKEAGLSPEIFSTQFEGRFLEY